MRWLVVLWGGLAPVVATAAEGPDSRWLEGATIEFNPFFFALEGYFIKVAPKPVADRWTVSLSLLSGDLPAGMANLMNGRNREAGFERVRFAAGSVGLDVGRLFGPARDGFHPSVSVNTFRTVVTHQQEKQTFWTLAAGARLGYRVYPGKQTSVFVEPAMALGIEVPLGETATFGDTTYRTARPMKAAGVHLGFQL